MDFTKMTPKRNEVIEAAEVKPLPPTDSYKPNEIAKALHPGIQHLKVSKIVENNKNVNENLENIKYSVRVTAIIADIKYYNEQKCRLAV